MQPNIKRFFELNNINEYHTQLCCNNFELKSYKKGEDIFQRKNDYKNFCIITKGKVLANSEKVILGYNNEELNNNLIEEFNDLEKFANQREKEGGQRQSIKFEVKKYEYTSKEYSKGEYFSRKIKTNDKSTINSVKALEDTDILVLDHRMYDLLFERSISRAKRDRKFFILNNIKTLKELPPTRFEIFQNMVEMNVK